MGLCKVISRFVSVEALSKSLYLDWANDSFLLRISLESSKPQPFPSNNCQGNSSHFLCELPKLYHFLLQNVRLQFPAVLGVPLNERLDRAIDQWPVSLVRVACSCEAKNAGSQNGWKSSLSEGRKCWRMEKRERDEKQLIYHSRWCDSCVSLLCHGRWCDSCLSLLCHSRCGSRRLITWLSSEASLEGTEHVKPLEEGRGEVYSHAPSLQRI